MGTRTSHRTRTFRIGLLAVALGLLLAGFGSVSPAGAERPVVNDHQVAVCHATPAEANPYVLTFPNKWQIVGPHGHGDHEGDVIPPSPPARRERTAGLPSRASTGTRPARRSGTPTAPPPTRSTP